MDSNFKRAERTYLEPEDEPQGFYDVTVTVTKNVSVYNRGFP